ncbi:MAG TPA: hypothetical protein VG387_20080 [Rhizomicrobium sp.]|jgi:hypothetical protein|nr:hypothetical protein [Rhizomicrobium sp.]
MAVSKFAVACVAAILAGGASAGLASSDSPAGPSTGQIATETPVTPIGAVTDPSLFQNVAVRFVSGKSFGHVVAVSTDARGRADRIRVALNDMPGMSLWLDKSDLVYSRSQDAIVAHDVHAPALAVASR